MLSWRNIKPKSFVDAMSMLYFMIMVHSAYLYGEFAIAPWMKETYSMGTLKNIVYQIFALFLYLNVMGNVYKIIETNTSSVGKMLPTLLKPGWTFCYACEANSPPRSFHCMTCNKCILKRDHHCMFTSQCIGHSNYRYYFWLVFYGWCGTMFCAIMTVPYVLTLLDGFSIWKLPYFILPLFCFMLQYISFFTAISSFITLLSVVFSCALIALLFWHCSHIYKGQTTFESSHRIYDYDLGWKENIIQSFGTKWYLTWICPWIISPLPSDGIEFQTKANYQHSKDQ
ncbi:palmitoyltransferase [Mytilus galloprovincialis]|uniref:Palmitoyltransferase n=2 Tax=Mytilus galloprovincialis TaxID=29158 RepID=A0A8B6GCR7_MYTGA|nr:palmitoyltransferase [Mytilus galloprovincialis]